MATADARDILGITNDGPRVPKSKKKSMGEQGPRLKGMQREARALQGDSVPPVTLTEAPRYKDRPNLPRLPARHWEQRSFVHGARTDGLQLNHWKRANIGPAPRPFTQPNGEDTEMQEETIDSAVQNGYHFPEELHFEKYNVKVPVPTYTEQQYEEKLKSEEWSKEETDYLIGLCRDFDLRWILIADRYEPENIPSSQKENIEPSANGDAMAIEGSEIVKKKEYSKRSMEQLKARYYSIAAKMLETQIPASNMTAAEFQLWEKMRNFDEKTEHMRKDLAQKLFDRTEDEAQEEKILLEELKRITMNEDEFLKMRRDLYTRLEPPPTKRSNGEEQSTAMYHTSSGLSVLLQNLLAREKRLKRPSIMPNEGTPTSATDDGRNSQKWEKGRHPNQYSRRDTLDSNDGAVTGPQKKSSQSQPTIRTLTPAEELKFGVSYPQERLTNGVAFRHEKATKVLQAKSSVQAQKISNSLTELGIPPRLAMPTERVCREFERLVQAIHVLLDTRKGVEKVSTEVKVLEEMRRVRLGLPKEGEEEKQANGDAMQIDGAVDAAKDATAQGPASEIDESMNEADKPDEEGDGKENEETEERDENEESKVEADDEEREDETENKDEDDQDDGDDQAEDASDAEVDDSDAEPAQASRKRRHEESSQVSDNEEEEEDEEEDEEETGLNQDDEDEGDNDDDEDLDNVQIDDEDEEEEEEEEADSNADLGSQNDVDVSDDDDDDEAAAAAASADEEPDEEDDADEDEVDREEDEEGEVEAEAEIEESEAPESARPGSSHSAMSRLKRSASVVSDASRAGSNRSGVGRKKKR